MQGRKYIFSSILLYSQKIKDLQQSKQLFCIVKRITCGPHMRICHSSLCKHRMLHASRHGWFGVESVCNLVNHMSTVNVCLR